MRAKFIVLVVLSLFLASCNADEEKACEAVKNGALPDNASVYATEEIAIDAPVEKVWNLVTDIDHWPDWMANVSDATLEGPLEVGSEFELVKAGLPGRSTLAIIEPNETFGWCGMTLEKIRIASIASAIIWRFEERQGITTVLLEESLEGSIVAAIYPSDKLAGDLKTRLLELKTASEQ